MRRVYAASAALSPLPTNFVLIYGYTEGPTVLKTDAALSKARAVNGCAYVLAGLGKNLTLKQLTFGQGTFEAAKFRRITITLTD